MPVPQPRGESWRVEWRRGGRNGTRESTTWADETIAKQAAALVTARGHNITADQLYDAILGPDPNPKPDLVPTVREWSVTWLKTRTRISPGQRGRYQQQLDDWILPAFGDDRLTAITGEHVADLITDLAAKYKNTTVTRYYTVVYSMFNYAVTEKKLEDNPARRTDFIRDQLAHDDDGSDEDEQHVYLTPAEYQRIHANAAPLAKDVLDVLVGTGARWSEATAAQVGAFVAASDLRRTKSAALRIRRTWKRDEKGAWYLGVPKGRKRRTITIGERLAKGAIARLTADQDDDALLLRAPEGGRLIHSNFASRYFFPAVEAAMRCDEHPPEGVTPSPSGRWPAGAVSTCDCPDRLKQRPTLHDLRHTHVAWLIAAGRRMVAISRRLGHASTAITEAVYAGILPQLDDDMADAMDEVWAD